MHLERVTRPDHPMYARAMELYCISFPAHEQREAASQERILGNEAYHFDLVYDGENFVGILLSWQREDYIYVEHFCILPECRNRRYGQRALALLQERGKPLILEIDPPVDPISQRRKGFYERCGFVENPYAHVHPPYHRGNRGHELVILSSPGPIGPEIYEAFRRDLEENVMACAYG